ncbi:hypothetical protein K443DRAFT_16172 [Laccaria amethystina LaAM-08-1]|uniref:Uncharacterized protein n=1 Tax=Laccaria amethystina LaAM-08-1 TaxID=1095629 RepID=A0A0C9WVX2_9AGAR|nr:hypothetical protein K443DRAFT_16172 [Laccaria amethystina LaAM-08-1]
MLLGEPIDHVHVHNLSWNPTYLAKLQSLEVQQDSPLSYHDPEFKDLNTKWIHEPGVHLGIRQARRQIIFMMRITAWEEMPPQLRHDTQANLQTLMDWTTCVHVIKNNAAQNRPQGYIDRRKDIHGEDISVKSQKLYGKMYGVGWHQSMESGKTLSYYAPRSCTNETIKQ